MKYVYRQGMPDSQITGLYRLFVLVDGEWKWAADVFRAHFFGLWFEVKKTTHPHSFKIVHTNASISLYLKPYIATFRK